MRTAQTKKPRRRRERFPIIVGDVIQDLTLLKKGVNKTYQKGRLLGTGGFAHCFEMTSHDSKRVYAGKAVPKKSLTKASARSKMMNEIRIHKSLRHKHVVRFERWFEDQNNVYIMLELCTNQTLMELVKRRKRLTEVEVQCFMWQLVEVMDYLHKSNVIHRDLKLGNLFLHGNMLIKLGDFGLAAKLEHPEERKKTICGTPNYIAPEILDSKNGHSFEVDIWSMGVIMYTMLVGKPPFETENVRSTYKRIKATRYVFPTSVNISRAAKDLIMRILDRRPESRPTLQDIREHEFFSRSPFPALLPSSVLTVAPHFNLQSLPQRVDVTALFSHELQRLSAARKEQERAAKSTAPPPAVNNFLDVPGKARHAKHGPVDENVRPANRGSVDSGNSKDMPTLTIDLNKRNSTLSKRPSGQPLQTRTVSDRNTQATTTALSSRYDKYPLSTGSGRSTGLGSTGARSTVPSSRYTRTPPDTTTGPATTSSLSKPVPTTSAPARLAHMKLRALSAAESKPHATASAHRRTVSATTSAFARLSVGGHTSSGAYGGVAVGVGVAVTNARRRSAELDRKGARSTSTVSPTSATSSHRPAHARVQSAHVPDTHTYHSTKPAQGHYRRSSSSSGTSAPEPRRESADTAELRKMHANLERNCADPSSAPSVAIGSDQAHVLPNRLGPKVWVSKWIDCSKMYGIGYQLSNGSLGAFFNDNTKLVCTSDKTEFEYITRHGDVSHHKMNDYPPELKKKVSLISYFDSKMSGKTAAETPYYASTQSGTHDLTYVRRYMAAKGAMVFRLSNKCIQVTFRDASELVISSEDAVLAYVDKRLTRRTYSLDMMFDQSNPELHRRVLFTKSVVASMLGQSSHKHRHRHHKGHRATKSGA